MIQRFNNETELTSLVGKRETLSGQALYFASPIKIKNPACLNCHSTVDAAPASMIKLYGTANGFGWKLNEVVGAQIVTVPMELSIQQAHHAFCDVYEHTGRCVYFHSHCFEHFITFISD